jgi:hypothetical protein
MDMVAINRRQLIEGAPSRVGRMSIMTSGGDAPFAAEPQAAAVDVTINSDVRTITVEPWTTLLDAIGGHLGPSWRRSPISGERSPTLAPCAG